MLHMIALTWTLALLMKIVASFLLLGINMLKILSTLFTSLCVCLPAYAATITFKDDNCSSFSVSGDQLVCNTTSQAPVTNVPVCILYASASSITAGQPVTCPGATSVSWSNSVFGAYSSGGVLYPTTTTTYSITGKNASGEGATAYITVNVASVTTPQQIPLTCSYMGNTLYVVKDEWSWDIRNGSPQKSQAMSSGNVYIYKLDVGAAQAAPITFYMAQLNGMTPSRIVVISETPCDFNTTKQENAFGAGSEPEVSFSLDPSNNSRLHQLKPNTTYFINIINTDYYSTSYKDTCPIGGSCNFIMTIRK